MGVVAAVYLLLRFFLPVPGCPTGYAGAGGLADQGAYDPSCVGGAAGYLNILLFGPKHSYGGPTCKDTYGCGPYDPEGAMGALMASWMAWLGLSAGRMLEAQRAENKARGKGSSAKDLAWGISVRWVAMGLLLCLGAGLLCGCAFGGGGGGGGGGGVRLAVGCWKSTPLANCRSPTPAHSRKPPPPSTHNTQHARPHPTHTHTVTCS